MKRLREADRRGGGTLHELLGFQNSHFSLHIVVNPSDDSRAGDKIRLFRARCFLGFSFALLHSCVLLSDRVFLGEKRQKAQVRQDGAARASVITAANPHHDSGPEQTRETGGGGERWAEDERKEIKHDKYLVNTVSGLMQIEASVFIFLFFLVRQKH